MDINGVYLVKVYVKTDEKFIPNISGHPFDYRIESAGTYLKDALGYNDSSEYVPRFIDLKTKEVYGEFSLSNVKIGQLYINLKEGITPVKNIINFKKENMSKRKILKKYEKNKK